MTLLLLLACNPFKGIKDRWHGAWEACDPESVEGRPDPFNLDATLSADCQDRLLDDLNADRAALEAVATTDETPDPAACAITGAYDLLTRDGGRFGTTQAGDGVYPVFLDQLQEVYWQLGGDDNRQLAYNYTTWFTSGVLYDDGMSEGSLAATHDNGLHLNSSVLILCGPELGHVLFHEAGRAVLDEHIHCPEDFEIQDCPDCVDSTPRAATPTTRARMHCQRACSRSTWTPARTRRRRCACTWRRFERWRCSRWGGRVIGRGVPPYSSALACSAPLDQRWLRNWIDARLRRR